MAEQQVSTTLLPPHGIFKTFAIDWTDTHQQQVQISLSMERLEGFIDSYPILSQRTISAEQPRRHSFE
jgi:hypothetical protein